MHLEGVWIFNIWPGYGAAAKHTIKNRFSATLIMHLQSVLFGYLLEAGVTQYNKILFSTILINCRVSGRFIKSLRQ